ncbi:hypothetical protein Goarm_002256 [Gossypium armourianum]|uniref:DUF4283 domain-containing protein n=1 Tax=Gossypium armourianum TaxID=34283 RepID=A0A7J9K7I4_9ROSI|nr:hypothetical protein [Gossypium armourianum]
MTDVEGNFPNLSLEDEEEQSMRVTLVNVGHLIGGISISDLNKGKFLFRLYHKVDVDRIEAGGPWNFNSHLLVTHRLKYGDDPKTMLL